MPQRFRVHEGTYPHFLTSTIIYWIPVFCREEYFRLLAESLTFCCREKGLQVHGYVLMPNHFHAVCSQLEGRLSAVIADLKGFTSRQLGKKLVSSGRNSWVSAMRSAAREGREDLKLWQDEFHPEQVYSEPFFMQKLNYMHDNPVRAGFVRDPADWVYSSAGFYYRDQESVVPIVPIEW